ncbi:MAG: hypothetical protein IJU76_11390, partial [Desulfovibrionaceae bacterium]|nr:hypothetical protein [Desulfovibrionaceae bacterium]
SNRRFPALDFRPGKDNDALQFSREQHFYVSNCIIDTSEIPQGSLDEACGITHGASAEFDHCLFRGAGKLVLIGSGDKKFAEVEKGKTVVFKDCWFDHFGRRGPEIQSGMNVLMDHCLISNWGSPDFFDVRAFGVWVHEGAYLNIKYSAFIQSMKPTLWLWIKDHANHIGQAIKDGGIGALFKRRTYASGYKRAPMRQATNAHVRMTMTEAASPCTIVSRMANLFLITRQHGMRPIF